MHVFEQSYYFLKAEVKVPGEVGDSQFRNQVCSSTATFVVYFCIGDGRVALIGFPSVGKSSLLNAVTDTKSEAAAYEFTTLTCIPGNLVVNDTKIQMLDLPGIIEGAAQGRGRGREVISVARSADLILMVLDGAREENNQHRDILSRELEIMGIRLNRQPPDIYFRKKPIGGIKFNSTCPLTQLGDNPQETVSRILGSYRIHNAEILIREDVTIDDIIDVIEENRKVSYCCRCCCCCCCPLLLILMFIVLA